MEASTSFRGTDAFLLLLLSIGRAWMKPLEREMGATLWLSIECQCCCKVQGLCTFTHLNGPQRKSLGSFFG